jgi:hypothetical protein
MRTIRITRYLESEYHTNVSAFILYTKIYVGRAMAQAVSRRHLTAEARVRSRISPCGICGGQSGIMTGLSPSC